MHKETEDVNYASLKLKVPDSGTDWLDEMITKSLRDYFAAKAMTGCLPGAMSAIPPEEYARWAYRMADAMLKARAQ